MAVVVSTSSFVQNTIAPPGSNPKDGASGASIFDDLLAMLAPAAAEPSGAAPVTADALDGAAGVAALLDAQPEQYVPEVSLPGTPAEDAGAALPPLVLFSDPPDGMAKEFAAENPSGKAVIASPAPSPKPGTQRDETIEADENMPDNTAAIAVSGVALIAQAIAQPDANTAAGAAAAAIDSEQIVAVADETRGQAPQISASATDLQTPSPTPTPPTPPTPVATPGEAAADIGKGPQMVAASAEQKPAAPSLESRSKTEMEKKPAPKIAAVSKDTAFSNDTPVSKDEAQEPSPPASTAGQSHADSEKNPPSGRSTKPNSAEPAPRSFTPALAAQSENSDLPAGLTRTPVPGLAAPSDFGLATAALAVGAAHDGAMPLRLSLNAAGIAPDAANWDGLALRIAAKSAGGESNFQIRLDPPHLGRIEIQLNMDSQGNAQAQLSADRPQTLEALQRDASALERAMKDAGLDLAGGLSFSLKGDGKSAAWRDAQNASRNRVLQIADGAAADTIGATAVTGMGGRGWGLVSARLDIRV